MADAWSLPVGIKGRGPIAAFLFLSDRRTCAVEIRFVAQFQREQGGYGADGFLGGQNGVVELSKPTIETKSDVASIDGSEVKVGGAIGEVIRSVERSSHGVIDRSV